MATDNTPGFALAAIVVGGIGGYLLGRASSSKETEALRREQEEAERGVERKALAACGRRPARAAVPDRSERISAAGRRLGRG